MAIACFLLVTFLPDLPLFSVPSLRSCIAFLTFFCAFLPYLAIVHLPSYFIIGKQSNGVGVGLIFIPQNLRGQVEETSKSAASSSFSLVHIGSLVRAPSVRFLFCTCISTLHALTSIRAYRPSFDDAG